MKISLKWLREYVDVDVPLERLAEILSMSGTKVESVTPPRTDVSGVIVAEVLRITAHPNADTLVLVDVTAGDGEAQRVVCGARNFEVGDRVPLATVGSRLGGMKIDERKIRGEVSRGMLCSPSELGVARDHSGIMVLPPDAPLGDDVAALIGLDDTVIDLEITPNRPDCMSHVGIGREVAALVGRSLRMPDAAVRGADGGSAVTVDIRDPRACPRYVARTVDGVAVRPSPAWMQARLIACGVRPISNVVDITNYVLLETGHPLHAFDAATVSARTIVVRMASEGEMLTTLDGQERKLTAEDLVIADPDRAIALAGIMGGEDTEVSGGTTSVILESAHFHAATIAFTSRRQSLRTEASARFERGADPEMAPFAAARAARLLAEIAGGRASADVVDSYPAPLEPPVLTLRAPRTSKIMGYDIATEEQVRHLESIGISTALKSRDLIEANAPTWRPDLAREIDLVEEVGRLAGFDRIPATIPSGPSGGLDGAQRAERRLRRVLAGCGLYEAWTSSFASPSDLDALGLTEDHPARRMVMIENPTVEGEPALRTSLLPGLLRAASRNLRRGAPGAALFEIARVYDPTGDDLPEEPLVLGAVFAGRHGSPSWRSSRGPWDFFAAKGILEAVFDSMELPVPRFVPATGMPFHPTRAAGVSFEGGHLGVIGEIHPEVCGSFDVPEGAVVFELGLAPLVAALPGRVKVGVLSRFPAVNLDVAVVVDEPVAAGVVEDVIARAGAPEIRAVALFDVYRGPQVPDGKKSLAYALQLRADDRTLTDEEANAVLERVLRALRERTGAELRS